MRLQMLFQVGRVLTLKHRCTALAAAIDSDDFANAHVRIGQVFEMFPDGAAASAANVLGMSAPVNRTVSPVDGVRGHAESVDFRVEAFDVFL